MNISPNLNLSGLLLYYDAANHRSYNNSDGLFFDISKNDNDGKLNNLPQHLPESGGCLLFDGLNDFIRINKTLELQDHFTIIVWIKPLNISYDSVIFCSHANENKNWIGISNGKFTLFANQFSNVNNFSVIGPELKVNEWCQIAASVNFREVRLYHNGMRVKVVDKKFGIGSWTSEATLGKRGTSDFEYFHGMISNIQVFNRIVYEEDITNNFISMRNRFQI